MFDLSGRAALVTGGNGGIGLGFARGLAKAGAAVTVAGRNAAKNAAAVADLTALGSAPWSRRRPSAWGGSTSW
jgi:2-deoxy-D-gluconate 3-dehydrogenase